MTVLYGSGWDRTAPAGLAVVVLEAAEGGDAVAVRLAEEGAGAGPGRGDGSAADGPDRADLPIALAGGVFLASASYRERFERPLRHWE